MKSNQPCNDIISEYAKGYLKEQFDAFIEFVLLAHQNIAKDFLYDNESDFLEYVESVTDYDTVRN